MKMDKPKYERILLARTDRLGDLLLTTPAVKAVRLAYPDSYIAIMVRPYTELAVKPNPYLDEVIVYDKEKRHRSPLATIGFAMALRKKSFDLAIIFHPTNRAHIISYLAGIPRRIGYDEKLPFLLTDRIKNRKHEGRKHESEYNLDMLKLLNIEAQEKSLHLPVDKDVSRDIEALLIRSGVAKDERIVVLHPGASCPSKVWPSERFAKLADRLISRYRVKIIITGGGDKRDLFCAESVKRFMLSEAVSLSGMLNISQLAALLKKAALFISNDSGPVHMAVAVGTPVISIFGRNQPGLSPARWGPLGANDRAVHKDVGCAGLCLAHDCRRGFACLAAISVDDLFSVIEDMHIL